MGSSYLRCVAFLAVLVATFSALSPHFFSLSNFDNVLSASVVTGLLAIGVTFVVATGGIDLSIASVMALAGTASAAFLRDGSISVLPAALLCVVVGGVAGGVTGTLVVLTRAPSFIVTLGVLSVARALAYIISDGVPIYGLPEQLTMIGQGRIMGVSTSVFFFLLAAVVAHVALHRTVFGVHVLALGDNFSAARSMGVRVDRLQIAVYALSGAFAGLAGLAFMARTNAGDPTAGQNYELIAITAVILGGTKLFGGNATITGTVIGVICLGVLQNGLNLLAISTYYQVLFVGVVLVGAALLERVQGKS